MSKIKAFQPDDPFKKCEMFTICNRRKVCLEEITFDLTFLQLNSIIEMTYYTAQVFFPSLVYVSGTQTFCNHFK